jgi:hypothetical protein
MIRRALKLCICVGVASLATQSSALSLDDLSIAPPPSEEVRDDTEEVSKAHAPIPTLAVVSLGPSSTAAITAAMLFPGAGHFYVGGDDAPGRGVGFLLGELIALTAFVVGSDTVIEEHYFYPDGNYSAGPVRTGMKGLPTRAS